MARFCSPAYATMSLLLAVCCSLLSQFASAQQVSLRGCPSTCGNLTIPYPFGIGTACARAEGFHLTCNRSFTPHKTFIGTSSVEVLSISLLQAQIRVNFYRAYDCYRRDGSGNEYNTVRAWAGDDYPYTFSNVHNRFTVLGCDTYAYIYGYNDTGFRSGCISRCDRWQQVVNGTCSGLGCCQISIPKGLKYFRIFLDSFNNHTKVWDFNPCSYAFLVDQDWYTFQSKDITNASVYRSTLEDVPLVMDWVPGNQSCEVARGDRERYACRSENSVCYNSTSSATGYLCNCSSGYEGNPYLDGGCQDIDECKSPEAYPCKGICSNIPGSYQCECAKGTYGNATYGCSQSIYKMPMKVILVTVFLALFVTVLALCLYGLFEKRKRQKNAEKLYQQNGGPVLQVHLSTHRDIRDRFKIFTKEELEKATDRFDDELVLGTGGQGEVYRGTLPDGTRVAIKKSVQISDARNDGFINEIIILSNIFHPNVVKLIGCCLEVDIPYLVYEFVPNKTLSEHIHGPGLSWEKRLRVAASAAEGLAHLHAVGVYHQDVKSANILLTMDFAAKISDFGLSRLAPTDAKALSTLVQGTIGYLDPEFFVSHKFTDKSDVFSFGVVLAELLTGKVPLSYERSERERALAQHFKLTMEENKVFDILDQQIVDVATDAVREQLMEVSKLADRCLNMKGKDRPDMMVVFQKLRDLWKSGDHQSVEYENVEDTRSLLAKPYLRSPDDENEEAGMLFHSIKSDHIAAFDIEAGR